MGVNAAQKCGIIVEEVVFEASVDAMRAREIKTHLTSDENLRVKCFVKSLECKES